MPCNVMPIMPCWAGLYSCCCTATSTIPPYSVDSTSASAKRQHMELLKLVEGCISTHRGSVRAPLQSSCAWHQHVCRLLLALGGVDCTIKLALAAPGGDFLQVCSLTGHADWLRSLAFTHPGAADSQQGEMLVMHWPRQLVLLAVHVALYMTCLFTQSCHNWQLSNFVVLLQLGGWVPKCCYRISSLPHLSLAVSLSTLLQYRKRLSGCCCCL